MIKRHTSLTSDKQSANYIGVITIIITITWKSFTITITITWYHVIFTIAITITYYYYLPHVCFGLVFGFLSSLCCVILFTCQDYLHLNVTLYKLIIVPQILLGAAFGLILPKSLEFFLA